VLRRSLYLLALLILAGVLLFVQLPIPPTYAGRTIENAGHMPLFFLVTLGVIFVLRDDRRCQGLKLYLFAGLAGVGAGFLSEVIQRPLRRDASWEDVVADAIGALCALAVYAMFERRSGLQRWHRLVALLVAVACVAVWFAPVVTMTRAYLHRNGQFPVLASFHSRIELYWTVSIGVRREIRDGALDVEFVAEDTPGISFHEPVADWRAWKTLVLDVQNPAGEALNLGVRVHDKQHNRQFNDRFNRRFDLAPGERRTLTISLDDVRNGPRNRRMDMQQISDITLFRGEKTGSRALRVHAMRLE
jgi:VanZ family protein